MHPVADPFIAGHRSSIPGIALLLDPERLAATLHDHLPGSTDIAPTLVMNPSYLRFKPGSSCLVAYRCELGERRFVCYAKAFSRVNATKVDKARGRPSIEGPLGPGQLVIARYGLVVWFFPNDGALRSLRRYMRKHTRIQTLAYKPERRFVGLLDADTDNPTVLKIYNRSAYERARALAAIAHRVPILPDVVDADDKRCSLRLRWTAGRTLSDVFQNECHGTAIYSCGVAATLLAQLHAHAPPDALPAVAPDTQSHRILSLAAGLVSLCPHLLDRVDSIAERMILALGMQHTPPVMIHGDFYANQVLLAPDGHRLLDFDELALGARESDIGLFIAHLHLDVLRGRMSSVQCESLASTFINTYRREAAASRFLIDLYTAIGLFQLSHRPFRDMMGKWSGRIASWLELIHRRLEDLLPRSGTPGAEQSGYMPSALITPHLEYALDPVNGGVPVDQALASLGPEFSGLHVKRARLQRHKPGRRALICYDLCDRGGNLRLQALGKLRAKGLDERTFTVNQRLFELTTGSASPGPLRVPRPLAIVPPLNMWLQTRIDGADGWQALDAPDAVESAVRIGEALHRLHSAALPTARTHDWRDELAVLEEHLRLATDIVPHQRQRIDALIDDCSVLARQLSGRPTCGIHRDFYPDQVLLRDDKVYILDMDLFCTGDPAVDIGNFVAHIQERDLRAHGDPNVNRKCHEAFFNAYFARSNDRNLPFAAEAYRVLTLARHVYISTRFADRQPFTTGILSFCENELRALLHGVQTRNHERKNPQ